MTSKDPPKDAPVTHAALRRKIAPPPDEEVILNQYGSNLPEYIPLGRGREKKEPSLKNSEYEKIMLKDGDFVIVKKNI